MLDLLLSGVRSVLGNRLIALYLHGSLASGDFDPSRSDIDFVVVTAGPLSDELVSALAAMHARVTNSGLKLAAKLEGSYIPQAAFRRYDPAQAWHPSLRVDGSFDRDHHASDWVIQLYTVREQGIAVAGPPAAALIDPIQPDELRRAARGILHEWWAPQLRDHTRLCRGEYQAYAILTMCRILYTLQQGSVVPKPAAARWAQEVLGQPWAGLIGRALAWRPGVPLDVLNETLGLIRYTIERARRTD